MPRRRQAPGGPRSAIVRRTKVELNTANWPLARVLAGSCEGLDRVDATFERLGPGGVLTIRGATGLQTGADLLCGDGGKVGGKPAEIVDGYALPDVAFMLA